MPNLPTSLIVLLAGLCLVMIGQLSLMAIWARTIRRDNAAAIAGLKHALHCWSGHGERHNEVNRELAYQAGHIERIEFAMAAFVQRMPALSVDESNLRDFFALGEPSLLAALTKNLPIDVEWERRIRAAANRNPAIAGWSSGLDPAPPTKRPAHLGPIDPVCVCCNCGGPVNLTSQGSWCPSCGSAKPAS